MNQIFWGLFIYLLSIFGCANSYYDSEAPDISDKKITTTIAKAQYQDVYDASLAQWNTDKKAHNDSYKFAMSFESVEGQFGFVSEFIVKNGILVERSYRGYKFNSNGQEIADGLWTETETAIGEHNQGFAAKTLTEIYEDCGNIYIHKSPDQNEIHFEAKNDGILSICGYFPYDCADDCFEGAELSHFEWLK